MKAEKEAVHQPRGAYRAYGRRLALVLLCLAMLGMMMAPGCAAAPDSGAHVYLLNLKPEQDSAYQRIAQRYTQLTGIPVTVTTTASGTYDDQLAAGFSTTSAPTIFQVNGPVGYAKWESYMADLSQSELYQHLLPNTKALASPDGSVGAIPFTIEGYGIIINTNIMKRYYAMDGAKARSIDDIRSFATLEAVVTDMQARKDELGIEGVFAPVSLQHGEDWPWQTHLFNEALYYEWTDKGVDVSDGHTPLTIGFDYAQNFKQLFDLYLQNNAGRPGDTAHVTVDDMMTAFAQGKAAMVQNGNWSFSQIINAPGSVVNTGDLGFLPMYFGVEGEEGQGLCVGCENYYCINRFADAESQKASLDFLTWLYTSEEGMQMVNGDLGFLPPFDTFTPLSEGSGNALSREVLRWDSGMTDIRNIPWVFDVIPNQRFKNTFGGYLQQYAIGSLSWDELVDKTVSEWTLQADGK